MTVSTIKDDKAEAARIESMKRLMAIKPSKACPDLRDTTMINLVRTEIALKQTIDRLLARSIQLAKFNVAELKAIWSRHHYSRTKHWLSKATLIENILNHEFSNDDE